MDKENDTFANEVREPNGQGLLTEGFVISLHIAPAAHVPMTALSSAHLVPGRGIVGDRYYLRRGRDVAADRFSCDVTLVEEETIEAMRRREPHVDPGSSARRNIVVRGCALSQLVGHTFRIGDVLLRGLAPRNSSNGTSESTQMITPLESTEQAARCLVLPRSDLRTDVLTDGIISVGDRVERISENETSR